MSLTRNFRSRQKLARHAQKKLDEERLSKYGLVRIKDFLIILDDKKNAEEFLAGLDLLCIAFASPTTNENWQYSSMVESVSGLIRPMEKRRK